MATKGVPIQNSPEIQALCEQFRKEAQAKLKTLRPEHQEPERPDWCVQRDRWAAAEAKRLKRNVNGGHY
ncbi:MAG: hypothetical protein H6Q33_1101 [Deltaproteobacteria bacterium]|nr:hypothetical protein [Deltaproteobacteria bacterium]